MKNFTQQNFKTNPLWVRLLIMALMMLVGTSSAWAYNQSAVDLYFDDSEAKWSDNSKSPYVYIGHSTWTTCYGPMTRVDGTQYLFKLAKANFNNGGTWNGASGWVIANEKWWEGKGESIDKYVWHGDKNVTKKQTSAWVATKIYKTNGTTSVTSDGTTKTVYALTSSDLNNYTVTIESVTGGTLTVKDYDDDEVSNGASKSILTVLKFSAAASTGYTFKGVQINNGSSTTTISAANIDQTYTITSNVTITPVWEKSCDPPAAPELTNPSAQCGGFITLPTSAEGVNLKWYDAQTGGNVVSNTEITATGTYWAAAVAECESTSRTEYTVTINPIPEVNSLLSTLNICIGSIDETDLTTLSHVEVSSGSTAVWYTSEDGVEQAERANLINGGTYWVAAENSTTGCKSTTRTSFTININDLPQHPSLGKYEYETCAHASNTVSLNELAGVSDVIWFLGEEEVNEEVSIETAGIYTYTAKAVNANGCQSATGVDFKLTVNSLPTITSITASNDKPVPFEDVELTATGNDIASVEWDVDKGTITADPADSKKAILAHSSAESVTVTATATSANGCTASTTKSVTFSAAEDCADVTTTKEETVGKIKLLLNKPSWIGSGEKFYCYAWENNTTNKLLGEWPGAELTQKEGSYYVIIVDSNNKNIKIILNDGSEQTVDSDVLNANKIYQISATSSKNSDNKYTFNSKTDKGTYKESITTTVPAPITAPAVKTVSVNSEQGSGVVEFTGQIIKTGCAATSKIYYGYQFKKADEEWPTTGVEASNTPVEGKLIPLTNASETALYYQFSANVENLEDVDYHFRAYIINGYDFTNGNYDQGVYYGLDKLVTVSTVQTAVTTATIQLTDADGKEVDKNKKYCVGETGYIKVTSDVKYTTIKWKTDKGTEIEETGNDGVYPFVAKGDDNIWVMLSNKHNKPESPAINENPLVINTFADPILPRVSLNKVSICSNDAVGATVKLTNVVKGQTYQLYQQIDNGDGNFTEQAIGDAKTQTEEVTDKTELVLHTLNNTYTTGKYFVKTYTSDCEENIVSTQPFTFTVVDAAEVFISIDPASADTTPWMPAKFTVNASDAYTLNVTKGNPAEPATEVEVNQNGNKVSVKIPLPKDTQHATGQYQNVTFPQGAITQYTLTATLSATGGDNPCAAPTSATINLVPYVEECTVGH